MAEQIVVLSVLDAKYMSTIRLMGLGNQHLPSLMTMKHLVLYPELNLLMEPFRAFSSLVVALVVVLVAALVEVLVVALLRLTIYLTTNPQ
tara:strand:+ start:105 stop:374 length:270 start_codon:yes stop_codon:yes gene_type:complete